MPFARQAINDLFTETNQPNDHSCMTGATTCHSKATCVDYEYGYCCNCKPGYFGNGKSCQPIGKIYFSFFFSFNFNAMVFVFFLNIYLFMNICND